MIETEIKYEFEVAFSFLQVDEKLATEINDLIQDKFATFLYSERQKILAGTDGEQIFNGVFGEKARIVVIFYRDGWGTSPWTRIEETAIRNRAHTDGFDFTTFVQLDEKSTMPKWLPKNRIYYNFERWGKKGLAPVIEARIQEAGGLGRPDTLEDQASRMKRRDLNLKDKRIFLYSHEACDNAQEEFNLLYSLLDEKTKSLEDPEINLYFSYEMQEKELFVVACEGYRLYFTWRYAYSNSLTNSGLSVGLNSIPEQLRGDIFQASIREKGTEVKNDLMNFDFNPITKGTGWTIKDKDEFITSERLMEKWLKLFMEKVSEKRLERHLGDYT